MDDDGDGGGDAAARHHVPLLPWPCYERSVCLPSTNSKSRRRGLARAAKLLATVATSTTAVATGLLFNSSRFANICLTHLRHYDVIVPSVLHRRSFIISSTSASTSSLWLPPSSSSPTTSSLSLSLLLPRASTVCDRIAIPPTPAAGNAHAKVQH